jgi:8-amino-7-oxononanoate synthase
MLCKDTLPNDLIDFASNDYLGFSQSEIILRTGSEYLIKINALKSSDRFPVLSGNRSLLQERFIAFPSNGNSLNFQFGLRCYYWFFSAVPQKEI